MLVNATEFVVSASEKILAGVAYIGLSTHISSKELAKEAVDMAEALYTELERRGHIESNVSKAA